MSKIRVLIADDHLIVRMGISALLSAEDDIEIVGEAKNGTEAVSASLRLKPDVVIMDIFMPKKDGITATAELHRLLPAAKILILTSCSSSDSVASAIQMGASGIILKSAENTSLAESIRAIHAGRSILPGNVRHILKEDPPAPILSPRQRDILDSLTRGLSNDDIAQQLGIGTASVKTHIIALFQKLGAANRTEAAAIALRKNLLKI